MLLLLLLAAPATSEGSFREVMEAQLRSPPRPDANTGLSAQEAAVIRQRYLESIGQRPPRGSGEDQPSQ
ncbi:MAG TPA: hypothetical protein VJM09_00335 [Sphingobium sp.]|nr:hypothetical protein [Sphingobium sp.]